MKRYLVRLVTATDKEVVFDEVPASVFEKRQFAKNEDGSSRYHCNDFVVMKDNIVEQLSIGDVHSSAIALICRAIGVKAFDGAISGGFVRTPTHIKFEDKRRAWLIELATGQEYKMVKGEKKDVPTNP